MKERQVISFDPAAFNPCTFAFVEQFPFDEKQSRNHKSMKFSSSLFLYE